MKIKKNVGGGVVWGGGGGGGGARVDVKTKNLSFCENSKKNIWGGGGGGWVGEGGGGWKIQKKNWGGGLGGGRGRVGGGGGQGGCERRIEVFAKIQKKKF